MQASFPLLFAVVVGFSHAFEADHLVAVGNLVSKRKSLSHAVKDGIYWGLGHTSTIFLVGLILILGKATFLNSYFSYLEGMVGVMLVLLGCYRLYQHFKRLDNSPNEEYSHQLAYGVGLMHGIAGSGAMILLVMTEIEGSFNGLIYLLIFGFGSIAGMLVAAGIFSLPFSKMLTTNKILQTGLILLSSLLCIGYGFYVMVENFF
jgi:high-affinity nickel permease